MQSRRCCPGGDGAVRIALQGLSGLVFYRMTVYINSMRHARTIKLIPEGPLPDPVKGRGTTWAIEHRYSGQTSESFDDGWGTLDQSVEEEHLPPATTIIEEHAKSIMSSN